MEIWDTSNRVLATLFSTNPGNPLLNRCTSRSADISTFIGRRVRVAFTEEDNLFFFNIHLDDIRIDLGGSGCNPQNVSCPGSVSASLSSDDCRQGRRGPDFLTDAYQFNGRAGDRVTIDLISSQFDTYLYLISPSGAVIAEDDDSGGASNARISITLPSSGLWRIEATSFAPGRTGPYVLVLNGCR